MELSVRFFVYLAIFTLPIHLFFEVDGIDNFYVTVLSVLLVDRALAKEEKG